jgi:hypothetical protein
MRTTLVHAAVATAALVVAVSGSAAPGPHAFQKTTAGEIEALAMDGSRIAYDVSARYGSAQRCNAVYVWNVATGTTRRVSGGKTCDADNTSTGAGVRELAVAGSRVAWIVNQGGNSESDDYLHVSSAARPGERMLAFGIRTGNVDGVLTGNWIGGLVGAGSFLAVNRWTTGSDGALTSSQLQRIGTGLRALASGPGAMTAASTDGRQVAVLRADASVGLYSTRGSLLREVKPSGAKEVALRGDYLAALTAANTLQVYNSHSGRLLHTWRVARGASHLDVSNGLAGYAAGRTAHVIRLATGRSLYSARTGSLVSGLQLEPAGLAYALDRPHETGKLVFVPLRRFLR